jgi:hypothetical protein
VISPNGYSDGRWHQVVALDNASNLFLFVDGTYVANMQGTSGQLILTNANMSIGYDFSSAATGCGTEYFSGNLSNIQVYSGVLTTNAIKVLYSEGIYGLPVFSANLVAWYPLNGNANDYSGSSNNAVPYSIIYPYFSGTYNAPGLSAITGYANEWQALGLSNT